MSYFSKRALRWAAPVALVGALGLAACGDNDDSEATRIAAPGGVNAWLSEQALERAQLDNNRAEVLGRQARANAAASARLSAQAEQVQRAQAARLAAQAEQYERSAHLEGQAKTHGGTDVPTNSDANLPNAFEAGNRAVLKAQAERYVEQLQDRAESNSEGVDPDFVRASNADTSDDGGYEDEFLPGSHHVPTR
ncbi:MAG: hypothetical protein ACRD07_06305 [Acidimicrobiales bacterium]